MLHTKLEIVLKNSRYPIFIGEDLLRLPEFICSYVAASQLLIVSNQTVGKIYLPLLQAQFPDKQCDTLLLPEGEAYKTLTTVNQIFDLLLQKKHHRNTTLIALGGGVICDMTGFAAACYQRGVNFIQIPTSLLAQVDASIGGKTAVNHPLGKNMIGAFYQPQCVVIDINVLKTLPDREFRAGVAEIIKAAAIQDKAFFEWLESNIEKLLNHDKEILIRAIKRACEIKAAIVMEDEKETTGRRALLNFGHTLGHAIEQVMGYGKILHGEAVAIGMVFAAKLSTKLNKLEEVDVERLKKLLIKAQLPVNLPSGLQFDKILSAMSVDKKFSGKGMTWILLQSLGKAMVVEVTQPMTDLIKEE